ncbi:hypothetical protein LIER_43897 [Lithospermum erythrorhizon]|uniref:BURP domain-containing protein n=1 Tax=Lithospermum erythrorhizon TaxID=34254 RepID=A0AAV3R830_LITER
MEQGATSIRDDHSCQEWGTSSITSGSLPQDIWRPKTKDPVPTKEKGPPSPRERTHETNQEQVGESKDQPSRHSLSRGSRGKDSHQILCHELTYPYAVYKCHSLPDTRAYKVSVVNTNEKKINVTPGA